MTIFLLENIKQILKLIYLAKRFFSNEVEKYCYMWREGGQFSTKNYKN